MILNNGYVASITLHGNMKFYCAILWLNKTTISFNTKSYSHLRFKPSTWLSLMPTSFTCSTKLLQELVTWTMSKVSHIRSSTKIRQKMGNACGVRAYSLQKSDIGKYSCQHRVFFSCSIHQLKISQISIIETSGISLK